MSHPNETNTMNTSHRTTASEPVDVAVIHKDPLVRAGLAVTLAAYNCLNVRICHAPSEGPAPDLQDRLGGADVVISDYDQALLLARSLQARNPGLGTQPARVMIISDRAGEWPIRQALEAGVKGYFLLGCHPDEIAEGVIAVHRGQRRLGQTLAQPVAECFEQEALTRRQFDVLRLLVAGHANKVVARQLDISLGTVKAHVKTIMDKLGAHSRTEAAALAQRRGLVGAGAELAAEFGS